LPAATLKPEAHTLLFMLSVLAIVPLGLTAEPCHRIRCRQDRRRGATGPAPTDLQFWPGTVMMMLIAAVTASVVANARRSTWFVGIRVLMVYSIFATTLYRLPPGAH